MCACVFVDSTLESFVSKIFFKVGLNKVCLYCVLLSQGRKSGTNSKIRATVAPLPPSSASALCSTLLGPPAKVCRPALLFSSSNGSGANPRALGPPVSAERPVSVHQEEESLNME